MPDQLSILASLCIGVAFMAGMFFHQQWIDLVNWWARMKEEAGE